MEEVFPGEILYYLEQVFAILGNFRAGMADKCYEEKGQCLDKARWAQCRNVYASPNGSTGFRGSSEEVASAHRTGG